MATKPVSFESGEFRKIGAGDLDPAVLPSTVVTTDGAHAFTSPQSGVTPTAGAHLTTKQYVADSAGAVSWQGPVLSATTTAQPGHSPGARYLLPSSPTGAQWSTHGDQLAVDDGVTWTFFTPVTGWVVRVSDTGLFLRYASSAWVDLSADLHHNLLQTLQGGTSGQYYHLTSADYGALTGSKTARLVLAAPTGASGSMVPRALEAADIQSGIFSGAHGGLGANTSSAAGYGKWTAGVPSFSATIPWADIVPPGGGFTPSAHASTHASGGPDQLALDTTQLTTGQLGLARGGTGINGASVSARLAFMGPASGPGALALRAITPDDVSGASIAGQVLQRNAGNTANVWDVLDFATLGGVPSSRLVSTTGYLSGGGSLAADRTLSWAGVDVKAENVLAGRRPKLNFTGAVTVTDNSGSNQLDVAVGYDLDPITAAIVFGG